MIFHKPLTDGATCDIKKGLNKEYRLWYDYAIISNCVIFFCTNMYLDFAKNITN